MMFGEDERHKCIKSIQKHTIKNMPEDTKINDVMNAKIGRKEFIYLYSTQKV